MLLRAALLAPLLSTLTNSLTLCAYPKIYYNISIKTDYLELYTDYLISNNGQATATRLSAMMDNTVSHDQITRFLSKNEFTSKELWMKVKKTVREVESDEGCLVFDNTVQEKKWTDESDIMCWHFEHTVSQSVRGINRLNALYYSGEVLHTFRL
jgi:hypothetical protein